jgi:hypothetical protein
LRRRPDNGGRHARACRGHFDPVGSACPSELAGTSPAMTIYCRLPQKRWMRVHASSSALVAVA